MARGSYARKDASYDLTRAAYDEQRALELEYQVMVQISLETTYQRGVYRLRAGTTPTWERDGHLRHSVSCDFPSVQIASFEAILYQQIYKLARMCEEAHNWAMRQETPRQQP